ncbi:MAG: SUMF1/EgtB/PvdO family nonheme iron enzyme [Bacteroidota bacterium]|nr:SUMF1/EgtB/PvdO family nonheme iron enzyme [Bacteroidota bacterium]
MEKQLFILKKVQNKKIRFFLFFAVIFLNISISSANNLSITGLNCLNPGSAGPQLNFQISWSNCWNVIDAANNDTLWDAVWVFVKYQNLNTSSSTLCDQSSTWSHAPMSSNYQDYSYPYPLQIDRVSDNKGIFIRRARSGTGDIPICSVTIALNLPAGTYNFYIVGIEMAHVSTASFNLGDGTSTNSFSNNTISGEGALTSAALGGGLQANIPAAYPKGYNGFYVMKYEITQQQYVEFLNMLTYDQQAARTAIAPNADPGVTGACAMVSTPTPCANRNGIKLIQRGVPGANSIPAVYACDLNSNDNASPPPSDIFNNTSDGMTIAMNYLSWGDLLAYLEWAALRPMTNFEYEKIARGQNARVAGEYAWGSTSLYQATSSALSNGGQNSEVPTSMPQNGYCAYGSAVPADGPLRVGFAATSSTNRIQAACAYYGVQNLSGNVWEMVIGGSNAGGNGYKLTSSDVGVGALTATGNNQHPNWQTYSSAPCTHSWHMELRGGSYKSASTTLRVSDRSQNSAACGGIAPMGFGDNDDARLSDAGGRGVRQWKWNRPNFYAPYNDTQSSSVTGE